MVNNKILVSIIVVVIFSLMLCSAWQIKEDVNDKSQDLSALFKKIREKRACPGVGDVCRAPNYCCPGLICLRQNPSSSFGYCNSGMVG